MEFLSEQDVVRSSVAYMLTYYHVVMFMLFMYDVCLLLLPLCADYKRLHCAGLRRASDVYSCFADLTPLQERLVVAIIVNYFVLHHVCFQVQASIFICPINKHKDIISMNKYTASVDAM